MKTTSSNALRLTVDPEIPWHHRLDLQGVAIEGAASRRTMELPRLDGVWKRLRAGHLRVMEVSAQKPGGALTLSCDLSRRLVHVEVPHGSPVCVNFARVIAMTANVRVRSCTNLSLPAICTRRVFVSYVECTTPQSDGGVVLEISGETCALSHEAEFDISRLAAWNPHARFRMANLQRLADVVLTQPYVRVTNVEPSDTNVLLEPGDGSAGKTVLKRIVEFLRVLSPV